MNKLQHAAECTHMTDKIWICDDEPSTRFPVWTRGNVGEVFVEVVSPLNWSVFGRHSWEPGWRDAYCAMGVFEADEFKPAGEPEVTGCFGGYVYINMSATRVMAVRVPGLTVEAMDRSLFGDYPDVPPYRPDPRDENAARSAAVGGWLQSLFTDDPKPIVDADRKRFDAMRASRPDFAALSDAQLLQYVRSLTSQGRHAFRQQVLTGYGANVVVSFVAQMCQAAGAPELSAQVTAGLGEVESAGLSLEPWELSRQVRASPILTAAFDAGVDGVLGRLRASSDASVRRFLEQWDAYIRQWDFYGPSLWELRSPTYAMAQEVPLRMLERARFAPDSAAPALRAASLAAEREAAIAQVAKRLEGNAQAQGQFVAAARASAAHLSQRERCKIHCAMVVQEARAAVHELGGRMVQRGQIARWEDVLLITDDEADAFVANPGAFSDRIAQRNAQLAVLLAKEPPFVFEGQVPPLATFKARGSAKVALAAPGTQLTGLGVSPGRYTGRARVITSLDADSGLEPGEVIVAPITDASWGPLFLAAGAVVVETGAMISHAAIVARELGIPAAVSVTDATRRIRNGATVTVDGNAGTVVVH
jgi:pyruvate,water dikinase